MKLKPMTQEDVAACTGYKPAAVAEWPKHCIGPRYYRIGNRIFYDPRDVDAWLRGCRSEVVSEKGPRLADRQNATITSEKIEETASEPAGATGATLIPARRKTASECLCLRKPKERGKRKR